jgi:hypothetical protein
MPFVFVVCVAQGGLYFYTLTGCQEAVKRYHRKTPQPPFGGRGVVE